MDALRCHRSQIDAQSPFTWLTADQATRLLGREYFVRAAAGSSAPAFIEGLRACREGAERGAGPPRATEPGSGAEPHGRDDESQPPPDLPREDAAPPL
jgi:hypothetical protein